MILYIDAITQKNNLLNMFEPTIYILADEGVSMKSKSDKNCVISQVKSFAKWHKLPCLILIAIINAKISKIDCWCLYPRNCNKKIFYSPN